MSVCRRVGVAVATGLVLSGAALAGCGGGAAPPGPRPPSATHETPPTAGVTPSGGKAPSAPPASAPAFVGTSAPVTAATVSRTWRSGCPVGPDQLRLLHLSYWGFDDRPHVGTMVVNAAVVPDVLTIFESLYRQRFPIRRMQPEDVYDGSDSASMAADNTSAFNCRNAVAAGVPHWSVHAYGEAIDVNTVENPYVLGGQVMPPAGAAYKDRTVYRPGMAVPDGVLVRAFAAVGWQWGGRWTASPDYQHFSKSGG